MAKTPISNPPRPYELEASGEIVRLHRELQGHLYACCKEHHGTDRDGREFALEALRILNKRGL